MGKHKKEKKEKKHKKEKKEKKKEHKKLRTEENRRIEDTSVDSGGHGRMSHNVRSEYEEADRPVSSSMADMLQQRMESGLSQRYHVTASQKRREEQKEEMERLYNERLINKPKPQHHEPPDTSDHTSRPQPSDNMHVEERHVNEHDINEAVANIMRAEMSGNTVKLARLRKNLDNLRVAKERGMKIRIKRKGSAAPTGPSGVTRTSALAMEGRRFPDQDMKPSNSRTTVSDMIRNEKRKSARDVGLEFTKMHMKMAFDEHFENEAGADSDDESSKPKKAKGGRKDEVFQEKGRNVVELEALSEAEAMERDASATLLLKGRSSKSEKPLNTSCEFCIHNRKKHLIISMGEYCYLTIPSNESLVEGHCYIVPVDHKPSGCHLDDDTWSEVLKFREQLAKMFTSKYGSNCELVVMETAIQLQRFPHAVFECLPVWDNEDIPLIPAFFKKSFLDAGPKWASNKKVVEVKGKNLKHAVPRGFSYISVSFEVQYGKSMAHVIEDENLYTKHFAKEIIGGILDLDPSGWRNPRPEETSVQLKKVLQFENEWKDFDVWESS